MKNFYDLQDIKKQINISLTIVPVIDIQMPNVKIEVNNNVLYNGNLENKLTLKHQINLLEIIDIKRNFNAPCFSAHADILKIESERK
jgi:hypothetical protein